MKSICINVLLQNTANVTTTTIADFRSYVMTKIPTAKLTWCPDTNFIFPWHKDAENTLVASYLVLGDELAIGDGFPAVDYPTLWGFQWHINEWFSSATTRFWRTTTVACAWHYPATYIAFLITKGVKIANWTVWSQTGVDRFQGEGTKLFPYYPSATNASVPWTQDLVLCNSLSADPLGCRVLTGDSRWTLHPADPNPASSNSQKHIIDQALLQDEYPLFVYPEVDWLYSNSQVLSNNWKSFVDYLATKTISVISMKDYNIHFRALYPDNIHQNWMVFTWSWITKWNSTSSSNKKQYWYEDNECSVCIEEDLTTHIKTVEWCIHYMEWQVESYGKFSYNWTLYNDYSYRLWKSYKYDQYWTYNYKEIKKYVDIADKYFWI